MSTVTITEDPTGPDAPASDNPQRPDNVPEKFWDAEKGEVRVDDVLKSYGELEKKLGQPREPQKETQKPPENVEDLDPQDQQTRNILEANGVNVAAYEQEIATNGELSDQSYADLEELGFPRAMVDQYLAGAGFYNAQLEGMTAAELGSIYESVGGEEAFGVMAEWAAQNVSEADLAVYNDMVNSANPAQAKAAVTWMNSMYAEANGFEPSESYQGDSSYTPQVPAFQSVAQMKEAMRDPRYKADPAYRQEVIDRLAVSDIM